MADAEAPTVTWYYDYSSPYTYLASTRIEGLCRRHDFALSWKPILVGGIFNAINQSVYEARNTPAKVRYGSKDVVDWARYYGIPFRFPSIFPVNSVKALRGALLAIEAGAISVYSHRVFRAYWAEDRDIAEDDTLRAIARELVETVRKNVTIDWTIRENVRALLRVLVKRILRKHGYPPDKQEKATQTVLEQAEVLSEAWAAA